MILQPRTYRWRALQKTRVFRHYKPATNTFLTLGDFGVIAARPTRLVAARVARLRLFLKRTVHNPDRTHRAFWFNCFPHLPLTKKATGLRMGKGKGKLDRWFTNIRSGTTLLRFQNLRPGRFRYYARQVTSKLGIATALSFETARTSPALFKRTRQSRLRFFND